MRGSMYEGSYDCRSISGAFDVLEAPNYPV